MDPFKGPGWCKFYADGAQYYATDPELRRKAKSWRKSKSEDIVMVMIRDKSLNTTRIKGVGEYWQSDSQMAQFILNRTVPGVTVTRRIMKRIEDHDKAILIRKKAKHVFAEFHTTVPPPPPANTNDHLFVINTNEHVGMWFVLETDVNSGKPDYYLSPEKI
jgi:hypothetical protein